MVIYKTIVPSSDSLNGIINYLYPIYKSYYHNVISISASSTATGWNVNSLIDPSMSGTSQNHNWASNKASKSNVTVYFHKHLIMITNYSIRTQSNHTYDHPKSWQLDGSFDGKNWQFIDSQTNVDCFKSAPNQTKTFAVKNSGMYLYFRFTQTDINWSYLHYFDLGKLEFFGEIVKMSSLPNIKRTKCVKPGIGLFNHLFVILFI